MLELLTGFTIVIVGTLVGAWIANVAYRQAYNDGYMVGYKTGCRDTWIEATDKLVEGTVED